METFQYQKSERYFAQCHQGFEELVATELKELGARQIKPGFRGVYFCANQSVMYAVNYQSRLIIRVLAPLFSFSCRDREDLYQGGKKILWDKLFSSRHTFGIFANVSNNENINHSRFASQCLKDAIADYFRSRTGKRPSVDRKNPDVWINLHIEGKFAVISLDTSGGSLHRRGYRKMTIEAPMTETLAAAVVAMSGWKGEKSLYDPMCGSGTLLCEALMAYCRIPSGYLKSEFGFRFLPDFNKNLWRKTRSQANGQIKELPTGLIAGSDIDKKAFDAARTNCPLLPDGDMIKISRRDFRNIEGLENRIILCNPPYGIRLKTEEDLKGLYRDFGDFLKQRCKGSEVYIFFGNREMIKHIGLRPTWKKILGSAGLDGRLIKYAMY